MEPATREGTKTPGMMSTYPFIRLTVFITFILSVLQTTRTLITWPQFGAVEVAIAS